MSGSIQTSEAPPLGLAGGPDRPLEFTVGQKVNHICFIFRICILWDTAVNPKVSGTKDRAEYDRAIGNRSDSARDRYGAYRVRPGVRAGCNAHDVDVPVGREGAEDSTTHCTAAEVASVPPPLSPDSPSAHPQPTICAVGSPRVCQSPSASWLEDPLSPPPAFESWTLPRPSDPAAPPRLSAPSSPPSPIGPPAPPGSLVPPAPPWSVVVPPSPQDSTPPAAPRRSIPPAPLGSSLPPAVPQSSVAPAPPRTSGSPPRSPEPWALPWPSGSSVSPRTISSPSPPRAPPPPALPPSVGPLESSALPPPWLLPPSAPPWATIMAAAWVSPGSSF
ncbi:IgA FC receptor [Labeo rohita]|uniref:IgA FC receptor n=1 Tax=Labeo rohita TaxID=84645 RepID=A0ABQ8LFM3_LABRO|nr:IgA FC receptor [Labeo rohita]